MAAHQALPSLGFSRQEHWSGCHFLLQCTEVKSQREVAQSCPTVCYPMDCSLPGSAIQALPFLGLSRQEYWSGVPLPSLVRSMNQGKLEVVKQEMARVNINILGISELKWTWIGEFKSDDHHIYYCGQESLRRSGVAIIVNKCPKWSTWIQSQKWQNDLCSFPKQTIQYHGNLSLCPEQ